jgi:hypothetical protein
MFEFLLKPFDTFSTSRNMPALRARTRWTQIASDGVIGVGRRGGRITPRGLPLAHPRHREPRSAHRGPAATLSFWSAELAALARLWT